MATFGPLLDILAEVPEVFEQWFGDLFDELFGLDA